MLDTDRNFCSILFDVLVNKGVRNIVCSPGSRNSPLLIAASAREMMKKHFVADERSAAFVGLGISMVRQEPVALICTSGTALLNYAPAVAEAFYQGLPLIVISADRPEQWIDQDDSQTLHQDKVLRNFVKHSYSIPALGQEDKEMEWYVNRIANDAVLNACSGKPGPVHINIHLGEPLTNIKERNIENVHTILEITGDTIGNKEVIRNLAFEVASSKILLVAGFSFPDSPLQKYFVEFSRFPNVAVMAETISNLHLDAEDYSVDSVLTAYPTNYLDEFAPDIIISIGGALVSRKLKEYLRRNSKRCRHWSIGYTNATSDPFMSLTLKIETPPFRFFKSMSAVLRKVKISEKCKEYKKNWKDLKQQALKLKSDFIQKSGWSELKAFDILLNKIPSRYNLFLSNGTPIRYAQIIPYPLPHASYCNRGVSGIEGTLSTALGGGMAFKGKTVLITGDLSFSYEVGALGLKKIPLDFKIIVIDNQGGGIFRFLPSTSNLEQTEEYFCQPPILPIRHLAEGYGWDYFECKDEVSLHRDLQLFFKSEKRAIMRIICNGLASANVLKDYMNVGLN